MDYGLMDDNYGLTEVDYVLMDVRYGLMEADYVLTDVRYGLMEADYVLMDVYYVLKDARKIRFVGFIEKRMFFVARQGAKTLMEWNGNANDADGYDLVMTVNKGFRLLANLGGCHFDRREKSLSVFYEKMLLPIAIGTPT